MQLIEKTGQELETDYPYNAQDNACAYDASKGKVHVAADYMVKAGIPKQLMAAITMGPTAVTVEADSLVFQMYQSGIVNSPECGNELNHAITAVGYGTKGRQDYYIVRNSWGSSWGNAGYINIAAVPGKGICGIQQVSVWPTTN